MNRNQHIISLADEGMLAQSGAAISTRAQIKAMLDAFAASGKPSMTIFFHGGLVDEANALAQADALYDEFSENADTWPVFVVWHSGVLEVLQGSLLDIVQGSPIFRQVLQKVLKYAARKIPVVGSLIPDGVLELAPAEPLTGDAARVAIVRDQIEAERLPAADPEVLLLLEPVSPEQVDDVTDDDVAALMAELAADPDAQRALNMILAASPASSNLELAAPESVSTAPSAATGYLSGDLVRELQASQPPEGVEAELAIAITAWAFAGRILRAVIGRYHAGTDHGLVGTTLEELYRAAYADKVGAFLWDAIKANARAAYSDNAPSTPEASQHGMTVFLDMLHDYAAQHGMPKLNLVGHSAGAIHICHFVERAALTLGNDFALQNVLLTAPACTCDLFFRTLVPHRQKIAALRIFDMADDLERRDPLVKWLPLAYPHSLLYIVSGLLEKESDTPLLGLARHIVASRSSDDDAAAVRAMLAEMPEMLVLAKTASDTPVDARATFSSHYGETGPLSDRTTLDAMAALIRPAPEEHLEPLEPVITQEMADLLEPNRSVILGSAAGIHSIDDLLAAQLGGGPAGIAPADGSSSGVGLELSPLELDETLEAIIGENDLVDHAIVKGLLTMGRAVARIVTSGIIAFDTVTPADRADVWHAAAANNTLIRCYGTGWVFGSPHRLLMTNNHVMPLPEAAASAKAEFGYERDLRATARAERVLTFDPDAFYITSPNLAFGGLDYALVALSNHATALGDADLGALEPTQGITAQTANNIYIVQHPRGDPKSYVVNHNKKVNITEKYLTYISDTQGGSSGSPLFNDQMRLVGIHHLGNYSVTIGTRTENTNLGSRMEVILADIVAQLRTRAFTDEQVEYWFGRGALFNLWRRSA